MGRAASSGSLLVQGAGSALNIGGDLRLSLDSGLNSTGGTSFARVISGGSISANNVYVGTGGTLIGNGASGTWLKVVCKDPGSGGIPDLTGTLAERTFYWGIQMAESDTPNTTPDPDIARVAGEDELGARSNNTGLSRILMTDVRAKTDYDKTATVNATDELRARNNTTGLGGMRLFSR